MEQRDKILEEYYAQMGIAKPVYDFCMKVEEELKDRFLSIDKTAECNQMKVLRAMQKNHLSEACFAPTTGYGYNDIGRETLEKIYADVFGTEDALVRPQITCGTHALALALMSQLRPGDELLSLQASHMIRWKKLQGFVRPMALLQNMASVTVVDLLPDGEFDWDGIEKALNEKTKLVTIQRSKGYASRPTLSVKKNWRADSFY